MQNLVDGIGSQTLVSMELGRKNTEKAQDAMSTGFWALIAVSLMATAFLLLFAEPLTSLMGADERLLPFSLAYLKGLVPFILTLTLCFYSDAMLKALGHPKFSMIIMSLSVVINVLLTFYFVMGLDWGTTGASVATGLAFTIGLLGVMVFIVLQLLGSHAMLLFFDSSESQAFQIAADGLHLFAFVFLVNRLNVLIIAYFTALGEAKNSFIIAALRGLVFLLIGVTVLPIFIGINGVGRQSRWRSCWH